jgi:hypothetical protein
MIVFSVGTYAVNSIILGWVASTCGQTKEKKATSLAIVNMFANLSFVWTAVRHVLPILLHCKSSQPFTNITTYLQYLWPSWDEPRYVVAMSSSAAFSVACAATAWLMKWMLVRENRRIRQQDDENVLFYAY